MRSILIFLICMIIGFGSYAQNATIIPLPNEVKPAKGIFLLSCSTTIQADLQNDTLKRTASLLNDAIEKQLGVRLNGNGEIKN